MKRILMVLLTMSLLLAGCGQKEDVSSKKNTDDSLAKQMETLMEKTDSEKGAVAEGENTASDKEEEASETDRPQKEETDSSESMIPGNYEIPDGWVKSEEHSNDYQIFYVKEGHENDSMPDNISVNVGENRYAVDEHEQFREAIVKQLLAQLEDTKAELYGDGTYTDEGDILYIFTIEEDDVVTVQYYIVKDYGFCLIHLTNFSGDEEVFRAAEDMAYSFVWDEE